MTKDNDNAKEKHAKSNSKHQKAVALRTQWLKDNPDKKKEDWDYAIHLKAMNEKFTVKFKEEKTNTLTRFLTQPSAKENYNLASGQIKKGGGRFFLYLYYGGNETFSFSP